MGINPKTLFQRYLTQLNVILEKIPEDIFSRSLSRDMFNLETNAKIAINFAMRGYCPLLGQKVISLENDTTGKESVLKQLAETLAYLKDGEEILSLDDGVLMKEQAGEAPILLPQAAFLFQYIVPNMLFHMGMVYAIGKANDVVLSKGDFDGLHAYSPGFSFLSESEQV